VIERAGRVDISFNAIGIPNPKIRVPLVELDVEQVSLPIASYTRSYFLTARLAARRMVAYRWGVIMTVTAIPSRTGTPLVGGGGPAMAAVEALTRDLSAELAPQGILAWSVCGHRACRRQPGSRKASSFAPWHRE
jgi:NAD(P)-dependent dehydrogenase (short-subunit alcohol dehydrogenase family)